jgi:BirA family biotin operon repressor/biotin-[acetyl-CoA-carboxylase] ligase
MTDAKVGGDLLAKPSLVRVAAMTVVLSAAKSTSVEAIARTIADAAPDCDVEHVASTGSTNDDLIARARTACPPRPILRVADFQGQGRGRRGRIWQAAPGQALLLSVAIPLDSLPQKLPAVTLACAVAVAECLAAHGAAVALKWPNDLLIGGRKLAGILCELAADPAGRHTLVVGVGLNLHGDLDARGAGRASLDELVTIDARDGAAWAGRIAAAILAAARGFIEAGFAQFREPFNRLLAARGSRIDIIDGDRVVASGTLIEVDDEGRLLIENGCVRDAISVGDVSLRANAG